MNSPTPAARPRCFCFSIWINFPTVIRPRESTNHNDEDWLTRENDHEDDRDHDGLVHRTHPRRSQDTFPNSFIVLLSSPRYDVCLVN